MTTRAPFILGVLGGLAGLAMHAVLLVRFFSQSHGLFEVFLHLALAAVLGLAALLLSALFRRSLPTLAVFLSVLGILGFVPRPLSWAPAGVLLVAGGVLASASLWQSRGSSRAARPAQTVTSADGRTLHWSEAARLGPLISSPTAQRDSLRTPSWSSTAKTSAAAVALIAAAIVVSASLLPWDSATQEPRQTSRVTTASAPTTPAGGPTISGHRDATTTTTSTSSTATSTTAAAEDDLFDSYIDRDLGFSISYPSSWRNTDPSEVGLRVYGGRSQAFARDHNEAFVAAAFADWQGPTYDGCYMDFVWIETYEDIPTDTATLDEARRGTEELIDEVRQNLSGVELLQPVRDVQIGSARGFEYVWSLPVGDYNEIAMKCILVAGDVWYYLALAATEDDWEKYQPVYEEMLQSFAGSGSSPVF